MPALEDRVAFFYTSVTVPPSPVTTGTTMTMDDLSNAPTAPFYAVLRPVNQIPSSPDIGEVVKVNAYNSGTGAISSMTRDILGEGPIAIANGYVMYQYLGVTLDILEYLSQTLITRLAANFNFTGTATIPSFSIPFTLPATILVVVDVDINFNHNAAAGVVADDVFGVYIMVDGVANTDVLARYQAPKAGWDQDVHRRWTVELAAGAHTIGAETRRFIGAGQCTIVAGSILSVEFRNSGNETSP